MLPPCSSLRHRLQSAGHRRRPALPAQEQSEPDFTPPVSILKPVRGRDAQFLRSHPLARRAAVSRIRIDLRHGRPERPGAAGYRAPARASFPTCPSASSIPRTMRPTARWARSKSLRAKRSYAVLLVNDGDILGRAGLSGASGRAARRRTASGWSRASIAGAASSIAAKAEALGIATEFAPSVLVARLLSASGFALGSTMAFRAARPAGHRRLRRDPRISRRRLPTRRAHRRPRAKRVALADTVVETNLGAGSWRDVWKHQVRWSRTIRVSRPAGYFGYLVTQVTFWSIVAAVFGHWRIAIDGLAVRIIAAAVAIDTLGYRGAGSVWLAPFRDLFGLGVWAAGMVGREVEWRGLRFQLRSDGRICRM